MERLSDERETDYVGLNSKGDSWKIANVGEVGEFSRDGSPHATDETFNTASHFGAALLSLLGTILLIVEASARGEPWKIVSFSLYGFSLVAMFTASTLHHGLSGRHEEFFRRLDYMSIYPVIAGTFTPLCLVFYHDSVIGWVFCATVWAVAIGCMIFMSLYFSKIPKYLSMTSYITIGWMGACMAYWLILVLEWQGFGLFLCGGVLYTVGGAIFTLEQPNPVPGVFGFHELWHCFVILAAACHWALMYFFVLPWEREG